MVRNRSNSTQSRVTKAAKTIKEGADTVFDSVENAIEKTESAAMNAVDKTTDYVNRKLKRDND